MKIDIDLLALILSAVCLAEADNRPMTADDIAFLSVDRRYIDLSLDEQVTDGSIFKDGDRYRYQRGRPFTTSEEARLEALRTQVESVRPLADRSPRRLHS
jgi:hypothetical protein